MLMHTEVFSNALSGLGLGLMPNWPRVNIPGLKCLIIKCTYQFRVVCSYVQGVTESD